MTPWVRRLVWANVALFLVSMAVPAVPQLFMLVPAFVLSRPWTPLTYMFIHGGFWHIAFNMLVLFFFGPRLESRLGSGRFLRLYLVSGLMAALFSAATPYAAVVGASGAIYGVMLGFARYWPRDRILIWGIIPVEARWMVAAMTVLALIGILQAGRGMSDGIAHHAHLGGFAGAFLYLKWMERTSDAAKFKARAEASSRRGWRHDREAISRWSGIDREAMHEVNRDAYDGIMAKLASEGIGSLTDRERAFLDRFSSP